MIKLSKRLNVAASLVNKGARFADIGCDHGYVPAFLVENGLVKSAIASDINEGPLNSCKALVENENLDNIECRISNGLEQIGEDEVDDILIAGMGGDLISEILDSCKWLKSKHIIVNPMTHQEIVRKWFYDNGYEIINDVLVEDGKHVYSLFDAKYTGNYSKHSVVDYYLGNIKDFSNKDYFKHLLNFLENKQKSGQDFSLVINAIKKIL